MVKHISLIIGCVILSLSATLIVPMSCSPIGENEQKETHLMESRFKREIVNNAEASSQANAQSQVRAALFPYILGLNPGLSTGFIPSIPSVTGKLAGDPNGLAGLIANLNPTLAGLLGPIITFLSKTVGGLGGTLDKSLTGVGGDLGLKFLDPVTGGLGNILAALLGSKGGGGGGGGAPIPPKPIMPFIPKITQDPYAKLLSGLLASIKTQASSSSSSSASSSTTTTTETKLPIKTG